jgi:hypothetical protein
METCFRRVFAVALVALLVVLAASVLLVQAQSAIPKPDVPTFSIKIVDHSYDVSATTSIDPYTGQTINHPASHVENYTVDIAIKNQPGASSTVGFYYNVLVKGHYAENWSKMYYQGEGPRPSNSDYTTISYLLLPTTSDGEQGYNIVSQDWRYSTNSISNIPSNSPIDFQIEAMVGYWSRTIEFNSQHFTLQENTFSNMQTVTTPQGQAVATPTGSASPTQAMPTINTGAATPITQTFLGLSYGEIIIIAILAVIAVLLAVLIAVLRSRKVKQPA